MIQAMLANLGILLLMHLCINTTYHLNQQRKFHQAIPPILHILIVSLSASSMFYFPIIKGDAVFDLRLVPLIFIAFFHGWRYTLPVLLFTSLWKWIIGGDITDILLSLILPTIIPMLVHNRINKEPNYILPFFIISFSWFISDSIFLFTRSELSKVILIHYTSLLFASLIMYFFIYTGIRHLELTEKLQFYAEHDQLTGLYNMRKFEELVQKSRPTDKKIFIAMIDIDKFKKINDIYGHQIGDVAIKGVAKIIESNLKRKEFAARYGGDEFILYSVANDMEEFSNQLNALRRTVSTAAIIEQDYPISLSIGVAEFESPFELKEAIKQADKRLYLAKKMGRNRVC